MNNWRWVGLVAGAAVIVSSLQAAQPWDAPFQPDIKSIVDAASRIAPPEHPEVVILLEDHHVTIHANGRITTILRKVYRVEQKDAIDDWSSIEQPYQPWYQQPPQLKARVIAKDGAERWLDLKTVADAPAHQDDSTIFSDERLLRAPLPAVEPGSIVEYQIVIDDKVPLLDAGVAQRVMVPSNLPVERFHVVIEAEAGVNLRIASKLIPESALLRNTPGDLTRVECTLGPLAAQKHFEWNLPYDVTNAPYIAFSTGKSWQAIASRYASIVDQRVQNSDLKKLLEGIDLTGKPLDVAMRLAARLHKSVRYTGVEFGEAAIVPARPEETVQRGYGDCKDKAALLVAMLRAAGLKASVALLDSGMGLDVDGELPGMGVFDHAIVYVDAKPPFWIDATASDTRIGFLPSQDEGRLALIAAPSTSSLVKIPESKSTENWEHQKMEVWMSNLGPGRLEAAFEVSGSLEATARASLGGDEKKSPEQLESWVKKAFAAKSLGKTDVMARDDMRGPFHVKVEALSARSASTGAEDAAVALAPWSLFQYLPYALTAPEEEKDAKPRERDFVMPTPYQMEIHYVIHPPALFKAAKLPSSSDLKLGTALLSRHFETNKDGSIDVLYRFDSGKRRLSASEFTEFRVALKAHAQPTPELITFVPETAEFIALGQTSKAISLLREQTSAHPDDAMLRVRLSGILLSAGLGDAALEEAKAALQLDSKSSATWVNLGLAWQYDSFGRLRQGDWNFAEAEKALRKAAELDPDNELPLTNLAILLEHNQQGWRYGTGARMDEAIAIYRDLVKKPQHQPMIDQNLAILLLRNRRFDEAKEQLAKLSGEASALLLDAITAMEESPARAIVKAQAAYSDPRQRAIHLASVSQTLVQFREYAAASTLMAAAARLISATDVQARADMLAKIKHWQDVVLPETDARWPAQRLLLEMFQGTISSESVKALSSRHLTSELKPDDIRAMQFSVAGARQQLSTAGMEEESIVDLVLSLLELEKAGDDEHGYRIKAMAPGTPAVFSLYVVPEDGRFKLIGGPPNGLEAIANLVFALVDKNDVKGAQWWLDRIVKDAEGRSDGTGRPAVIGLWSGINEENRGPADIRIAAAAVLGSSTVSPKALSILEGARLKATNATDKALIDKAICETLLEAKKWDELMVAAKRLEASKLFSVEGYRYFIKAAINAQKWKELEAESLKMMGNNPSSHVVGGTGNRVVVRVESSLDLLAMRTIALARWKQGDSASVAEWIKKISVAELAGTEERVYIAWAAMGQDQANLDALDQLRKGKERAGSDKSYALALSMMEVVLGMPDDAAQGLARSAGGQDIADLPAVAWAIHGKICEQYGLNACAKSSRDKAIHAADASKDDESTQWLLAVLAR